LLTDGKSTSVCRADGISPKDAMTERVKLVPPLRLCGMNGVHSCVHIAPADTDS